MAARDFYPHEVAAMVLDDVTEQADLLESQLATVTSKLASVKPKSITKRMKQKAFAASVKRENILECEKIGIPLNEFAAISLESMQKIHETLGL